MRIIGRLNIGGPAIHVVLLTDLLDRSKYQTTLVTGVEAPTEGSMRYLAEERGLHPVVIPEMSREISWRDDLVALLKIMRLMRREKPEVIHTHTAKAGFLGRTAALFALPGRRKRLYHTFHGHVFHSYFHPLKARIFVHIERLLARYTHRIIAVSEQTRQDLIAYKIAPPEKIVVVPLGFDLEPFALCAQHRGALRQEIGAREGEVLIGIVARLVPVKNIALFLQAADCIAERYRHVRFVIVGDGECREMLEAQAQQTSGRDRIHFLGYRRDLPRIYADLDIVTLTSLNEGLPVSLIEAMASGCVVVSTCVGGVPELIDDGRTGFLVPSGDVCALVERWEELLERPEMWPGIGEAARQSALQRFHVERLVADIERLYAA
ncbi:MAG: glycosyltransferase family 4 protein [Chloroherpetonaceae bacterium]|nr:glycosyltransferase family 4 protein [Chthonomonadaceae bacterium]MDW8209081.1 glycosyltransferase family 4 protein [Chloroherpetonaceae bacterium]